MNTCCLCMYFHMPRKTEWKDTHGIINNGYLWRADQGRGWVREQVEAGGLLGASAGAQEEARRTGHSLAGVGPAATRGQRQQRRTPSQAVGRKKVPKAPATSQMCSVLWAGMTSAYPVKLFSKETHLGPPPPSLTTRFTRCTGDWGESL